MCLTLSAKYDENQNIKLNKNSTLSFSRKSLSCVAGIFVVTVDDFKLPDCVHIVLVQSCFWILTPGFNQSSQGEAEKCSSPVSLSLRFVWA